MRLSRLIWGIVLLFIGSILLLQNFNVIHFYWGNVWRFWPMLLIIFGVNILFDRSNSKVGQIISLVLLVGTLTFLFIRGQQPYSYRNGLTDNIVFRSDDDNFNFDFDTDSGSNDTTNNRPATFLEPYVAADSAKKTVLNISGGGVSFNLDGETDQLFEADLKNRKNNFVLNKMVSDTATVLNFKMTDKKNNKFELNGNNGVNFKLSTRPIWEVNMKLGAGEADFDFTKYKVRNFIFNGGASALSLKFSDQLPITDVSVKSGVADINIKIPRDAGCRITAKTGLSSKDFEDFDKISEGVYQTPNYNSSTKKFFIKLDGGLSSFNVERY